MTGGEYNESFLTVAEVAELLRLNQQTVRNWIDAGTLPAVRVGRRVRIKRSDLNRIVESGYQGSSAAATNDAGPSATDFWSGQPVGAAEPLPGEQNPRKESQSGAATTHDHSTGELPESSTTEDEVSSTTEDGA
jgi:excisionase family DNA binding protein